MKLETKKSHLFFALSTGLVLTFGLISFLAFMNQIDRNDDDNNNQKIVNFNLRPESKPKKIVAKKKPRKKKKAKKSKSLSPDLTSMLRGSSFGIDSFEVELDDLNKDLLGNLSQMAMTEDTVDVAPQVTQRPDLVFPSKARRMGITGHVVFNILVSETGAIEKVKILDSEPMGIFDLAATNFVKAWKFKPAEYKGESVSVWIKQRISFQMENR